MSTTIDHKVVEMRFDNRQFEQNVSQTMSSIDKLNNSLQLKGSTKGFSEIDDASRRTGKSLDDFEYSAYKTGFQWADVLRKVSSTAEWRIAQRAVDQLESSLKSLADQLLGVTSAKAGFSEYELKMGSVQTIMASTGETLETVNGYLNELNEYSDRTIYSFSDMTQNIGKFTNAGVSLKDSVAAIQGVANVAALSGANSNEASRAMYNFSQALSAGYVKLIDWKSIENANMATVGFKEELIKTALEMGTITKTSDGMYKTLSGKTFSATKNFNEVLQEQWMTSDVLTKTLANYADESTEIGKKATQAATEVKTFTQMMDTLKESAQSGWAQTWEIIFGDFNEGKALWTDISNVVGGFIDSASKARNEMLENWKVMGGREDLIQSFKNIFEGVMGIIKPIKEAFTEIFPPATSEQLIEMTSKFMKLSESFKNTFSEGSDAGNNLKRVFKGLFAILDIAVSVLSAVFRAVGSLFGVTGDLCGGVLGIAAAFGDALVGIRDFVKETDIFYKAFKVVANIVKIVIGVVSKIANSVKSAFNSGPLDGFVDALSSVARMMADLFESTGNFGEGIKDTFGNIGEIIQNSLIFKLLTSLWQLVKNVASGIAKTFGGAFKGISNAFADGDLAGAFEIINGLLSGGLIIGLGALIKKVSDIIKNFSEKGGVLDSFKEILDSVQDTLSSFTESIKAQALKTIASAMLMLVAALLVLTFIDKDKLSTAMAALTLMFTELVLAMRIMSSGLTGVSDLKGVAAAIRSLTSMALALLVMSFVLKIVGGMDMDQITRGIIGIGAMLAELAVAQVLMSRLGGSGDVMTRGAKSLKSMALALLLISLPLYIIGSMDTDVLIQGSLGIAGILATLVAAQILLCKFGNNGAKANKGAASLLIFAIVLGMIIPPLLILGLIPTKTLIQGVLGIAGVLAALSGAQIMLSKLAGGPQKMIKGAASLLILVLALKMVIPQILVLGLLDPLVLIQGVLGITAVLASLAGAQIMLTKLAGGGKKLLQGAASVAIIMAAVGMTVPMLMTLGAMDTGSLIKGVLGITAVAAALAGAQIMLTKLAGGGKKLLQGAASVAIIAASLNLIVPSLLVFGLMDTGSLIQGIVGMAAALAALGGVQIMLTKLAGGGKKMMQGAAALVVLSLAVSMLVPSLVILGAVGIGTIGVGLLALAGAFIVLGVAAKVLAPLAPTILTLASALALIGVAVLATSIGLAVFGAALVSISSGLVAFTGAMAVMIGSLTLVVTGVTALVAAVVAGIIRGIGEGIVALCEVLIESLPLISETLIVLVVELCRVIGECTPVIVDTLLKLIVDLLVSLADFTPMIVGALLDLIIGIINALAEKLPDLCKAIVDVLFALIQGTIDALGGMDTGPLLEALANVGIITAIMTMLAALAVLAPAAMLGVLEMASVMTVLSGAIAALGALSQIPGLEWLISEGGDFLQTIGTSIGQFIGGIMGGIAQGFTSSLPDIATDLSAFMNNLQPFIDGASRIDSSMLDGVVTITEIILALTAANILEGLTSWFTGGSSLAKFGAEIAAFGPNLKAFADSVAGIDVESVRAASDAAKILAEMADTVPNSGGVVAWWAGDNSVAAFGTELASLGADLKSFSDNTTGIDTEAMVAAAGAAKTLAEMTESIPNSGGVTAWWAGDNSVSAWGSELVALGSGLRGFAEETAGIDTEAVTAAANSAKTIAEMSNIIPNSGGVVSWFAGDNSVAAFGDSLVALGSGMKGFATETEGINAESVSAAANAAKFLAEMTTAIPDSGGIRAWFSGDNSVSSFAGELPKLGAGLKGFSDEVAGISAENVLAATDAAQHLADMATHIPVGGGFFALFKGGIDYGGFSDALPKLGKGIKGFSDEVAGISPDHVTAAAGSLSALAEITETIPDSGGFFGWFSGSKDYDGFKDALPKLGKGVKGFSDSIAGISVSNVNAGADAIKKIGETAATVPSDTTNLMKFGDNLSKFGSKVKSYFDSVVGVSADSISISNSVVSAINKFNEVSAANLSGAASAISDTANALKNLSKVPADVVSEFKSQLIDLGEISANDVLNGFKDLDTKLKTAGETGIKSFIDGFKSELENLETIAKGAATGTADAMDDQVGEFTSAGKYMVQGFANGISANTYLAAAKAKAMAAAAAQAAREELDEHSPSKVGYEIGDFFGVAFVNAIGDNVSAAYDASADMAGSAKSGLGDAIAKIGKAINSDMDVQPTIRPVLDLSDVKDGANSIASMFGFGSSIGVLSNVGTINSMMNARNQNGANDDVVTAIDKLRTDIGNMEHATYNINGITYGEDDEVAMAIETLVRAVKIGGRT